MTTADPWERVVTLMEHYGPKAPSLRYAIEREIAAIEAEAVADANHRVELLAADLEAERQYTTEAIAADRARIVAEIRKSLYPNPNGRADAWNQGLKCALAIVEQKS